MAIIDPLDPCLIFYPGELPDEIGGNSILDGGSVVIARPAGPVDPVDPVDWRRPPRRPPDDVEEPGTSPPVFVWVCRNGQVYLIRQSELRPGETAYTSLAAARRFCDEDPPSDLDIVWICLDGVVEQVYENDPRIIAGNLPVFPDERSARAACEDPAGPGIVWICVNGEVTSIYDNDPIIQSSNLTTYATEQEAREACSVVTKWKCQETSHVVGTTIIRRKTCVPTTDTNAPFTTLAECLLECQSVEILDGEGLGEVEPDTPETGGDGEGPVETDGTSEAPGQGDTTPQPENEYDDDEITYTAESVGTLPNYFPSYYEETSTREVPVNSIGTTIFASTHGPTVDYLLRQPQLKSIASINDKLKQLSPVEIKNSVTKQIADIMYNLLEPDGRKAPESRINASLQLYLLQGKARKINISYLLSLQGRSLFKANDARLRRFTNYIDPRFGGNQNAILLNRVSNAVANSARATQQVNITRNTQRGVARAYQSAKSLDYRKYSDSKSELLKLWNILPEDIYTKAVVEDQNGNISRLNVKNDLVLLGVTSGSQPARIPINSFVFNIAVETDSGTEFISLDSELDRAVTLKNKVEQACLFDVGVEKETILRVTSPSTLNLELSYDVNATRPNHFVLLLDASTIADAETKKSIFARTSLANYKLETDPAIIQDAMEYRVFPWLVMPVYHDDPVLGHFTTSSVYSVEFNDFSLEEFGDDLDGPIFIRKIPKAILIIPTDRYDYLLYNGQSTLDDWNSRSLSYVLSPDPNYYDTGLRSSWARIGLAYPNTDITNTISEHGVRATYETSVPIITNTFVTGQEPTRTIHGFRSATLIASSLNDTYNNNNGLLWSDIFTRMTEQEYKTYKLGISSKMMEKLRKGEVTGTRLVHDKGQNILTRLAGLKENKIDSLQLYLTRE